MPVSHAKRSGFPGAVRLFSVFGIDVFLHWSWAVVAVILLETRESAYGSQIWNVAEYLTLFGIVLLHEFGHALACRSVGGQANRILLWPLGGVAYVNPPRRPGALLWSIAAGPLVNVALLPVTFGLAMAARSQTGASGDLQEFLYMIALINVVLLVFNILPIYPLDGGQILRAILWFFIGEHRSLTVAATVGLFGAAGIVILALAWGSVWLIILALFGAMQSWRGLKQAKALALLRAIPRHLETRCPACHEAPPLGAYWRCECGQVFDAFATGTCCPHCGRSHATTSCPLCGKMSPHVAWGPEAQFTALPHSFSSDDRDAADR